MKVKDMLVELSYDEIVALRLLLVDKLGPSGIYIYIYICNDDLITGATIGAQR